MPLRTRWDLRVDEVVMELSRRAPARQQGEVGLGIGWAGWLAVAPTGSHWLPLDGRGEAGLWALQWRGRGA